jgi:hypothetical protein
MTDVMTVGAPNEPLPGPREGGTWKKTPAVYVDGVRPSNHPGVWEHDGVFRIPTIWPPINPVIDAPYYFPGHAWKGTSGMPQERYV